MARYNLHVDAFGESWMKEHETEFLPMAGDRIGFFPQGTPEDALQVIVESRFFQGYDCVSVYSEIDTLKPASSEGMERLGFERD